MARSGLGRGLDSMLGGGDKNKTTQTKTAKAKSNITAKKADSKTDSKKETVKSNSKTTTKTVAKSTTKSTSKAATKTSTKAVSKTTAKTATKSTSKATPKATAKSTGKAATKTTTKPASKATTKATPKSSTKSVTKPAEVKIVENETGIINKEVVSSNLNKSTLRVSEIEPNRSQPRKFFNEDALKELAESLKTHGMIEPIVVKQRDGYYEIIAGERRWRAAKLAKLKEVPVVIKDFTDREIMEIALIENIQREDLNPIEEAMAYESLIKEYDLLQEELAERLSKGRSTITNSMRLLKLKEVARELVITGELSSGHARTLIPVEDEDLQAMLARKIVAEKLSVRDAERLVKASLSPKKAEVKEVDKMVEAAYQALEDKLKTITGTKVNITRNKKGRGKIEIEYYSKEELDRIINIISGN